MLDDAALAALLATCKGNTFENRRDTAIIRLLIDTGMRAGELCGLRVEDVDFEQQVASVLGKGDRHRACPFGARTADALRRYLRFRTREPAAGLAAGGQEHDLVRLAGGTPDHLHLRSRAPSDHADDVPQAARQ